MYYVQTQAIADSGTPCIYTHDFDTLEEALEYMGRRLRDPADFSDQHFMAISEDWAKLPAHSKDLMRIVTN